MNETDTKPWWQSRTQVAILAGAVSVIAGMFGVAVDAGALTELAINAATLVSLLFAARGRARATEPLDTKQILPGVRRP